MLIAETDAEMPKYQKIVFGQGGTKKWEKWIRRYSLNLPELRVVHLVLLAVEAEHREAGGAVEDGVAAGQTLHAALGVLGGNSIGKLWTEKQPQYRHEN